MIRRRLILRLLSSVTGLALGAGGVQAQDSARHRAALAVAEAVNAAIPQAEEGWRLGWSGFGLGRGRSPVQWTLAEPVDFRAHELEPGVTRRHGWMEPGVSVAVCGVDDAVRAVAFRDYWLEPGSGEEDDGLLAALAADGFVLTLQLSRPHAHLRDEWEGARDTLRHYRTYLEHTPALREWRLEKPNRMPTVLIATHVCTPPGTRSATRCWTDFNVVLRGAFSHDRPEAILPGERCVVPGR